MTFKNNWTVRSNIASELKSILLQNLKFWFEQVESIKILTITTILDTHFKTLYLNITIASSKVIYSIKNKIVNLRIENSEISTLYKYRQSFWWWGY